MIVRISCENCGRTKFAKPVRGEFADVARVTKAEAKPLLLSVD